MLTLRLQVRIVGPLARRRSRNASFCSSSRPRVRFCRSAMPIWQALGERASAISRVRVFGVALDSVDSLDAYVAHAGFEFPVVQPRYQRFLHLYRSKAVPLTMAVDDSGRVLYAQFGVLDSVAHFDSLLAILTAPDALASDTPLGIASSRAVFDSQHGGVP